MSIDHPATLPWRTPLVYELELIDPSVTCDDCGRCCEHLGMPPVMLDELFALPVELQVAWDDDENTYRYDRGLPCLWYDAATKRCRHHEMRPEICRDFSVGGEDFLDLRKDGR